MLSHRFWTRQFGADPGILGRQITLDARPYTVIGVMPASFDFTADAEALWVPIAFTPERKAMHDEHYLSVYGPAAAGRHRRAGGAAARRDRASGCAQRFPKDNAERRIASVAADGRLRRRLPRAAASSCSARSAFVLLIACGNVSNLLLARGAARARELAVRSALGAGQGRLVRQLFTESLVLGLASAVAGVALARGVHRAADRVMAPPACRGSSRRASTASRSPLPSLLAHRVEHRVRPRAGAGARRAPTSTAR